VAGSRLKATPEPEVPSALPYTMHCTLTAVPTKPDSPCTSRYLRALAPSQLRNTAPTAARSCSKGSSGIDTPCSPKTVK